MRSYPRGNQGLHLICTSRQVLERCGFVRRFLVLLLILLCGQGPALAAVITANPDNYRSLIGGLGPGDTLALESGTYTQGLPLVNFHGEPGNPIVISGPEAGEPAIFEGSRDGTWNTVQINNASHLTIRNLTLDGLDVPFIDAVNARGITHHITLENLNIVRHGGDQGTVGIATRGPAWDWVIRKNTIIGAGTGMYLGNTLGNDWPFVGGLIEYNVILDTIGYNIEIKRMNSRAYASGDAIPGMPLNDRTTIIRHNVFSKAVQPSPPSAGPRPNLLVGHFPLDGPGSNDRYEIYGNFFYENRTEALFQGEGNIALYDNLFVNTTGLAVNIRSHNDVPRNIHVYHNTVLATGTGISVRNVNTNFEQLVTGNAVFASTPLSTDANVVRAENVTNTYEAAGNYLTNPTGNPNSGDLDLFPKPGTLTGSPIDFTALQAFDDWHVDFNGNPRDGTFRGAYAGEGNNPGWQLALNIKPVPGAAPVEAPVILTQPDDQTVAEGGTASFQVVATGSAPLRFQWRRDGVAIPDATGSRYSLAPVMISDHGAVFDCMVSNPQGEVFSTTAVLTVISDPNDNSFAGTTTPAGSTSGGGGGMNPVMILVLFLLLFKGLGRTIQARSRT